MTQVLFNSAVRRLASYKLMMIVWASTLPPFLPPPKVARSPPITAQKSTFDLDANCAQISSSRERLDRIHWLWEDIFQIAFAPQPQSLSPPTPHLCSATPAIFDSLRVWRSAGHPTDKRGSTKPRKVASQPPAVILEFGNNLEIPTYRSMIAHHRHNNIKQIPRNHLPAAHHREAFTIEG